MKKLIAAIILFLSIFASGSFAQKATYTDNLYDVKIIGDEVFAVGYYGTILHSKDRGNSWEIQNSGTNNPLFALYFAGKRKAWLVGEGGTILYTENGGRIWKPQTSNTSESLFDVFFINEEKGWASGPNGTILYTQDGGKVWENRSVKEDTGIYSIFFADKDTGWAAGEFGVIFHTEDGGKTWIRQKSPIEVSPISGENQCLFKIRFKDRNIGFAVGIDGGILRTKDGGKNWQLLPKVAKDHLFDVSIGDEQCFFVGLRGTVVAMVKSLTPIDLGVRRNLNGVCFDGNLGFIVGDTGTILRTMDGGRKWEVLGDRRKS